MSERVFCKDCKYFVIERPKRSFLDFLPPPAITLRCEHPSNLEEEISYVTGRERIIYYQHPEDKNSFGFCDYYEEK